MKVGVVNKVRRTIGKYRLFRKSDKILVAISGGKDSAALLHILKKLGYDCEAIHVNLHVENYSKRCLNAVKEICSELDVKLNVVDMEKELGIKRRVFRKAVKRKLIPSVCYACGILRKYLLNKKARELGASVIATGHNLDDEAETIVMNVFKGSLNLCLNLGPKTGVLTCEAFVPRVKPLYFCKNEETLAYAMANDLPFVQKSCPDLKTSLRWMIREFLSEVNKRYPNFNEKLVMNFLSLLPKIRREWKYEGKLKRCAICGEPSHQEICKACEVLKLMRTIR